MVLAHKRKERVKVVRSILCLGPFPCNLDSIGYPDAVSRGDGCDGETSSGDFRGRCSVAARGGGAAKRFGIKLRTSSGGGLDGRMWQMPISEKARSVEAIHRKLRALSAVFLDPAATEHEKANAKGLKGRLEKQLSPEATPEWAWTDIMFRLGRGVKEMTSPPSPKGDWTDHAFRLGRMLRRGFKR
jgi:hypothetical protein